MVSGRFRSAFENIFFKVPKTKNKTSYLRLNAVLGLLRIFEINQHNPGWKTIPRITDTTPFPARVTN